MKKPLVKVDVVNASSKDSKKNSRRKFIKLGGLGIAGSSFLLYGCSEDDMFNPGGEAEQPTPGPNPEPEPEPEVFDLGATDVGVFNYAYALEQLEADFYTKAVESFYSDPMDVDGVSEEETLTDIRNHEVIHREFFKVAIQGLVDDGTITQDQMLPELTFDWDGVVDFSSRQSVLETARLLEDTGVSAYNGAGDIITNGDYLLLAGKIVSVEARHASAIADLLEPNTTAFARDEVLVALTDDGDPAYDKAQDPSAILGSVVGLEVIQEEFTANELP
ncbi:MAG: ferritin-like domain-containing protein [Christiangramia sp.]